MAAFSKVFIIRALGGLAILQNDAFSKDDFEEFGSFLKVKQLIYLCPSSQSKLRRNASQRAMSFTVNATFETDKALRLTKIEKKYLGEIKKLQKNGYLVRNVREDLILLALIFDQLYHGGIPSDAGEVKQALKQTMAEYRVLQITCENVPDRLEAIRAHVESMLCLMETNNFQRVHHCVGGCHSFPSIFSTVEVDLFDDSTDLAAVDDFYLPPLPFTSNPDRERKLCSYSPHPAFPSSLIPRIRQNITQLLNVKEKYRFQAFRFFQGSCDPQTCVRGYSCESTLHLLQQLEGCFFGANVLHFGVNAYCRNIWLTSVMEEVKASGKFDLFKLCYLHVVSGANVSGEI